MLRETLSVMRGRTKSFGIVVSKDGVGEDINGWTILLTVKRNLDDDITDAAAAITKTVTSHSDPAHGISEIEIDPTDTRDLEPGKYFADIKIVTDTGKAYPSESGDGGSFFIIIEPDTGRRSA